MAKPNVREAVHTGSGEEIINLSPEYTSNMITILGLTVGTVTIRAMLNGNTVLETVYDGTIYLPESRTCSIEGYQLKQLGISVSPEAAYTVKVRQYKPVDEK